MTIPGPMETMGSGPEPRTPGEEPVSTYGQAIEFLYGLRWFGAKLGLRNTLRLAELAGNPHHRLRFIHVAGTNGKGSTCAMLEAIYRASGLRVGLFTSPHLVGFGERIQVNRRPISEVEVLQLVSRMRPMLQQFAVDEHPTFFEVVTVMALQYFEAQRCDLVVWETGLGGRLDATNVVTPLISVITNIQYDHQKWLGETLSSIAAEKAGIIKPGIPVVTGAEDAEALHVITATAGRLSSPCTVVPRSAANEPPLNSIHVSLLGGHQKMNAAVALAVVRALADNLPVSEDQVRTALEHLHWPGRLQLVRLPSGQRLLLDGAHNIGGAETLAAALRDCFHGSRPALVLGILRDKDWTAMCQILAPLAKRILLVPVHSERTAEPHGLWEACRAANPQAEICECASLSEALRAAVDEPFVTVAGSLYLVGEVMELLRLVPEQPTDERGLNEWTSPAKSVPPP